MGNAIQDKPRVSSRVLTSSVVELWYSIRVIHILELILDNISLPLIYVIIICPLEIKCIQDTLELMVEAIAARE